MLESLLAQIYKDLEIILVGNTSTDGSFEVCNALGNEDDRIKVIHLWAILHMRETKELRLLQVNT